MIPGSPKDFSAASLASPIRGVDAATDPVVSSAPCGYFYVAYVGFTRGPGGKSYVAVSRFLDDRNNTGGGEDIAYLDTKVVATGSNDSPVNTFLDKPSIAVDTGRPALSLDPCQHRLYVSYTAFDGPETPQGFESRIMVARSTTSGETWETPVKISGAFSRIRASPWSSIRWTMADRSMPCGASSRPARTPSGPHRSTTAILGAPKIITNTPLATFDQPSLSKPDPAFRSNRTPSMAVASNGRIYGVWQERVNVSDCPANPNGPLGRPAANGTPRIVMMRSNDFGNVWTDDKGTVDKHHAVDFGDRCEESVQPDSAPSRAVPRFRR